MAEWFHAPAFRGCAFINAVAEVGDVLPGVLQIAQRHKQEMRQVIAELLPSGPRQATAAGAAALAVDGAIVRTQMKGAESALAGLRQLLDALESPA